MPNIDQDAAKAKFLDLMRQLPPHLPAGWFVKETRDHGLAIFEGPGGIAVYAAIDWKGKAHCSPSVPMRDGSLMDLRGWGVIDYKESAPTASFSIDRPAQAVARDIIRKVIDPYQPLYRKIIERQNETTSSRNSAAGLVAQVKDILGPTVRDPRGDVAKGETAQFSLYQYLGGSYGEVNVSPHGSVEISLKSLDGETALAVVRALRDLHGPK